MLEKISAETNQSIAELLRRHRKAKGWTQQRTASEAGLAHRHYQRFEECTRSLLSASFKTTMAVLEALEIDPDFFAEKYSFH